MAKYSIGVDFGTLSGRSLLVNVETGEELASATKEYTHSVMSEALPCGKKLPPDYALQHPMDYLEVFTETIPAVIRESGVNPEDIIGLGIDFTACTVLPVMKDGTPLCFFDKFDDEPHAYVKLWKHHAAQDKANALNMIAGKRGEAFLSRYGGKISSEWMIPKIWQVYEEAPEVYNTCDHFIEAADWVVWQLTGVQTRNSCTAGYKAMWNKKEGYPSKDFFAALNPGLENLVEDKLNCPVTPLGDKAGTISPFVAKALGLSEKTSVAVANVDAHVTMPALKIDGPGKMLAIIGTSTCHILLGEKEAYVPGICGVVEDGVYPGYFGYEAGQSCVGDHFAWFVDNCVPPAYYEAAEAEGISVHEYLTKKADEKKPGESGIIALDWWNGNRSVLVDVDLTGVFLGMTLATKPEDMYRALIEATAFGTRTIIDNFNAHGVPVTEFYASGGISQKNAMAMQIYADIINLPVRIGGSTQGPALGSAIFGAVAAGSENGGYDDIFTAAKAMGSLKDTVYYPIPENVAVYEKIYQEYTRLHDYFGRGANDCMKRLKNLKAEVISGLVPEDACTETEFREQLKAELREELLNELREELKDELVDEIEDEIEDRLEDMPEGSVSKEVLKEIENIIDDVLEDAVDEAVDETIEEILEEDEDEEEDEEEDEDDSEDETEDEEIDEDDSEDEAEDEEIDEEDSEDEAEDEEIDEDDSEDEAEDEAAEEEQDAEVSENEDEESGVSVEDNSKNEQDIMVSVEDESKNEPDIVISEDVNAEDMTKSPENTVEPEENTEAPTNTYTPPAWF